MHNADGFEMAFTSRSSWKANIFRLGKLVEIVPVTWTKGWRPARGTNMPQLEVWFKDPDELRSRALDPTPFHVALAVAHDYSEFPHAFKGYQGLFEVAATGELLSDTSLQTNVIRRVRADSTATTPRGETSPLA